MHTTAHTDTIVFEIHQLLEQSKLKELHALLGELQPFDFAEIYELLPAPSKPKFVLQLDSRQLAMMIQELDLELQMEVLHYIGFERSPDVLDRMDNDDLADLLKELSFKEMEAFLSSMQKEESEYVQHLMKYDPETAGGIMTNRFVWIRNHYTVREAVDKLKAFAAYAENLFYMYVLDENKVLVGVVSYRDLLLAHLDDRIDEIMYRRVISVHVDTDQEEVARTIERYNFISVPVVDSDKHLLGIVTVDDVIDVIVHEAAEDIQKLSATGAGKKGIDFQTSVISASARRLPWLLLLLLLGMLSGSMIARFEETLERVVALTFFMPMIAGMTGNTGTQSLAIVIRGLGTERLHKGALIRLISRDFGVGLVLGLICGILIGIIAYIWQGSVMLSFVVSLSLLLTLVIGTLAGTLIPLLLYKLKIDPAIASGPLITTLNDLFSLFVYFGLATLFINQL
ncbi:magnesium transporter [Marinicrinis lubricantis]|uniref:Magnesium transporter MgtE n=1 Tax=Marinicrinis lubricantis TaxID=2086470 RepID=A0ABW1ILM7_9BACL